MNLGNNIKNMGMLKPKALYRQADRAIKMIKAAQKMGVMPKEQAEQYIKDLEKKVKQVKEDEQTKGKND